MLQLSERRFYAAVKDAKYIGIFSGEAMAHNAPHDRLLKIQPLYLEGSPVNRYAPIAAPKDCTKTVEYICMAKGTSVMLMRNGASCETVRRNPDTAWGMNPQSATIGLFGLHSRLKNITATEFYLFEVDRIYSGNEPANLHKHPVFASLTRCTYDQHSLSEEQIQKDYLKIYLDELRRAVVRDEKTASPELQMLAHQVMTAACIRLKNVSGELPPDLSLYGMTQCITARLIDEFSMQEMHRLASLLRRNLSQKDLPGLSETEQDLLRRIIDQIPEPEELLRRRSLGHRRRD